jgi:nucleoside-diphosphate-sugar epimerase
MRIFITGGSGFIGTHFLQKVLKIAPDAQICNYDLTSPKLSEHTPFWIKGDILDADCLRSEMEKFRPTHVVHMAARTDTDGTRVEDYRINTDGSANLLKAIQATPSIERALFISTQYVIGPGHLAADPRYHNPHTVYGRSKCIMEDMIWDAKLSCCWTIVRPTNIWGAWHPRYDKEFWSVLKRGRYLHPGGEPVYRAYGYVGNIVEQIWALLTMPADQVNHQVVYVGDPVDDIKQWVNAFSVGLTGRKARVVPRPVLRGIAFIGDILRKFGIRFPLFSSRYHSMTESYSVNMDPTYKLLGKPVYSLEEGVEQTISWLKTQGGIWSR